VSPEELDETWAVGPYTALDGVNLRKSWIALDCFFVTSHVEGQGILLAVISLEDTANGVSVKTKLVSERIVGTMSH
jgi:hypothetical protein